MNRLRSALFVAVILDISAIGESVAGAQTAPTTLAPCPSSPNCVISLGDPADVEHHIEAFALVDSPEVTIIKIKAAIESMPRTRLVTQTSEYIHAEFTSLIFRFVDDVEFLYDRAAKVVQVRSASRVGYSDLGANRKRIEILREAHKK